MNITFAVTKTTLLRHFVEAILELVARGHRVRIAASEHGRKAGLPPGLRDVEGVELVDAPVVRGDDWEESARLLRTTLDYLRYLDRDFKGAVKLRARALRKLVQTATDDARTHFSLRCGECDTRHVDENAVRMIMKGGASKEIVRGLRRVLQLAETAMPPSAAITEFLSQDRPDALLVTPLVSFGSRQVDYLKSARALGIPAIFPVFSWDNLTTKGLIHELPDAVIVWNEVQKREAVDLHAVPEDRVTAVGAPRFDGFFTRRPSLSYEEYCAARDLATSQPTVVYLCSSEFVAGEEQAFINTWLDGVRANPALADANVVVRPHPRRVALWRDWPGQQRNGVYLDRKPLPGVDDDQALYETLYHCRAAVGLNTSAEIEAGILRRPVFTLAVPEFDGGQRQAPHFSYLLRSNGGFVEMAESLEEHFTQLASAVREDQNLDHIDAFIERFVRPGGLSRPVAPIFADLVEEAAGSGDG